ncbi:DUF4892 domain-containing protein [Bradyrhizobium diazoefficiens]|uniref:OmpA family protein n=1 Tax=Bradyrhizobium diazoefficiens TaxID=1355477 RepID=UPI00190DF4ED|nr:OmpA family protein [Bradyrhizobium diazoefficiens]QQO33340.1 DUF4892 domain-containing protein [Bradyrhizobium diazoefficiens]
MTRANLYSLARVALVGLATCTLVGTRAQSVDKPGCNDVSSLNRFTGSAIVMCEQRNFAEYTLPTGGVTEFSGNKASFERKEDLEGQLTQIIYAVPLGASSVEVFRNYRNDLDRAGFNILFEAKQEETKYLERVFESMGPGGQLFGYSPEEARYAAAVKEDGGDKKYLALYVIEFQDGYVPGLSPKKGQVFVRLDVLRVGKLSNQMVAVSSTDIAKGLEASGKVALYGILFEFNKATIKPESRPTLDAVAKFLKEHPTQNVALTGHTDNIGGLEFNMRLSQMRAEAIAMDLSQTYGIEAGRMVTKGFGSQAPADSNDTEDGRAKNRRVELSIR